MIGPPLLCGYCTQPFGGLNSPHDHRKNKLVKLQLIAEIRRRKVVTSALLYIPIAWIGAEVMTFLFETFPVPAWSNDLVAASFVAGFPAFIVLAWTFDVGAAGITRTSASFTQGCICVVLSLVIMGVGTSVLFRQIQSADLTEVATQNLLSGNTAEVAGGPAGKSLVVYSFENLSSDPENVYFSEGVTSELITRLGQIKGLQVAFIAQSKQEVHALGLVEPDVVYRLEGSVRKAGDEVRIAARLTERSSGFTVWSEEFDGDVENVFELQEQTARSIVESLDVQLSQQESTRRVVNLQAYDAFLRGWSLIESFHISFDGAEEKLATARGHFQTALDMEPEYTQAIAGLSMVESYNVAVDKSNKDSQQLAREYAVKALAGDDGLYEPHFAMARVLLRGGDPSGALDEYRKVVDLDAQNGYAWCEMSYVLNLEDPVGAENAAREAIRFRPAYSSAYFNLGAALEKQNRLSEAVGAYRQSLLLDPSNQYLQTTIGKLNGAISSSGQE